MQQHGSYRDDHTKWNISKTNSVWYHLYMEPNKNDGNELIYKTETLRFQNQIYGYQRGNMGESDKLGDWD